MKKKPVKKKAPAPKKKIVAKKIVVARKNVVAKKKKVVAKRALPLTPTLSPAGEREKKGPPPPPPDALLERAVHPKLTWLLGNLKFGRHAGGLLQFATPGTHATELESWLMGRSDGRTSIGRTAFGELLVFRDLREHAEELGMEDAATACDVAAIDIHFKRMKVLATSAEEFVQLLDDDEWQRAFLRKPLYLAAKARLGEWEPHECYCFVPALALGGSEDAAWIQRLDWLVHQSLLRDVV